ncbi:MAG: endo alpha-1,4 polygalactosaminidase [Anaerolineales bacterium]|nr:endo alpha-1,4 polygalactosaminidase [Anaerolineales bacterium]
MAFLRFSILVVGLILVLVLGISWVCNAEMYDLADREEPGVMDETFPVTEQSISMPGIKIAATLFQATLRPTHTAGVPTEFTPQTTPTEITNILAKIRHWGYQIEGLTEDGAVDALEESHYEMLVLEPTRTDWSSDAKFFNTNGMVARLKSKVNEALGHPPLVIAYIDIGEAEDWRWYWSWSTGWDCRTPRPADWPEYIITCDPDGWTGSYPVAYWDPAWKDIIIYGKHTGDYPERDYRSVIDEVIKDGFDGVYLDWVEAFEDTEVIRVAQANSLDPADEMIAFIREMRAYARLIDPDFLIIQQNAFSLIDGHPELLEVVDAISQEAIWYDGVATDDWNDPNGYDRVNDPSYSQKIMSHLDLYLSVGLPVFDCEYALINAEIAYSNALGKGYWPYVTRRSLRQLTTTLSPGY